MQRGVFRPYTKEKALKIVKAYFNLTTGAAEAEIERLENCAIYDGLDIGSLLCLWYSKLAQNLRGDRRELYTF